MFFIPGIVITAITFPGVIVHELAHQFFCRLMRVPVYQVRYFQLKNPSGYVIHEASERPLANFLIAVGPFLVNTMVGALLLFPASMELMEMGGWRSGNGIQYLLMLVSLWLGISVLMHAFPSKGDAEALTTSVLKNKEVPLILRVLVAPVIGLIYVGSFGSMFWLDLGYGILVAALLPKLLMQIL